ncbi:MAG: hemolysin family protein [Candidatus Babeliales bacterium]
MNCEPISSGVLLALAVGFIVSLAINAIYSFLETSVTGIRLFKLKEMSHSTTKFQRLFATLEASPHEVLLSILIASSLASTSAATLLSAIVEPLLAQVEFSKTLGILISVVASTAFILVFGEAIPKSIAKVHGEKLFKSTLWITNLTFQVMRPFVYLLIKLSGYTARLFGTPEDPTESVTSEREIRFLIDYINEKGLMDKEKTSMLHAIFELGNKQVEEIMVPTAEVIQLEVSEPLSNAVALFARYQFSRLPVFEKTKDNIIGMIHQKDVFVLLVQKKEATLKHLMRPIMFVPETMRINQLLNEFRKQGMHIAVVLNEFGSITGIVTLEDVLEEIVGEINDEHEEAPEKVIAIDQSSWLVAASIDLDTLGHLLGIEFHEEDVISLGGFLTERLQHVPRKGEQVFYKNYYFYVHKACHRRVLQVLVAKDLKSALKYINSLPKKKQEK